MGSGGAPEDAGPVGPPVVGSPLIGGLAHELQVDHILGAMAYTGADAVCTRVSTADHHHTLVLRTRLAAINDMSIESLNHQHPPLQPSRTPCNGGN